MNAYTIHQRIIDWAEDQCIMCCATACSFTNCNCEDCPAEAIRTIEADSLAEWLARSFDEIDERVSDD